MLIGIHMAAWLILTVAFLIYWSRLRADARVADRIVREPHGIRPDELRAKAA